MELVGNNWSGLIMFYSNNERVLMGDYDLKETNSDLQIWNLEHIRD